jgi:hypothetical protein
MLLLLFRVKRIERAWGFLPRWPSDFYNEGIANRRRNTLVNDLSVVRADLSTGKQRNKFIRGYKIRESPRPQPIFDFLEFDISAKLPMKRRQLAAFSIRVFIKKQGQESQTTW